MELIDPKIDFVGLARSLGINAERAKTVAEATDLVGHALKNGGPTLIDVELDRAVKPMEGGRSGAACGSGLSGGRRDHGGPPAAVPPSASGRTSPPQSEP